MRKVNTKIRHRSVYWAASIDFNTFDIYIRQKKTMASVIDNNKGQIVLDGNVYGYTESEVLEYVHAILKDHLEKTKAMVKMFDGDTIPAVYTSDERKGSIIKPDLKLAKKRA